MRMVAKNLVSKQYVICKLVKKTTIRKYDIKESRVSEQCVLKNSRISAMWSAVPFATAVIVMCLILMSLSEISERE